VAIDEMIKSLTIAIGVYIGKPTRRATVAVEFSPAVLRQVIEEESKT
jgi:hypothetical protein